MSYAVRQIRVLVADNQTLVRSGIRSLLEKIPEVQIAGEAANEGELLRLVKQNQPDVVLIKDSTPALNAAELTSNITQAHPEVRVIILSNHADENRLNLGLSCGAAGFLTMTASAIELELAVREVARGGIHISPSATKVLVDFLRHSSTGTRFDPLTPRQLAVLRLIAEGHSTKQIALTLKISPKTVETHRLLLAERLGIHDTAGLVRYAISNGLVALKT